MSTRIVIAVTLLFAAGAARAAEPPAPAPAVRPASARGTTVVPDRFLRRWDPVTFFFARDTGPATPGPEDHAERWVGLQPAHPGAFTWLDVRTLQFRPAEPWPPLARFTCTVEGKTFRLVTLMAPPVETDPRADAQGLSEVEAITLTFVEPVPPEALAQAVTIEILPLPGVGGEGAPILGAQILGADDFTIKSLERKERAERASYVLSLREPLPLGSRINLRFRLSLDEGAGPFTTGQSTARLSFSTAEPFRALAFGCDTRYPATAGGTRYAPEQAIRCRADEPAVVVDFSAPPDRLGPVEARNLVRLTPAVGNLRYQIAGNRLTVRGDFARDTRYRVTLVPTPISDRSGRLLDLAAANELSLYFPPRAAFLGWSAASGIAERFGPRMVPVSGRGEDRLDLRIFRIDPLDRSFWPFPAQPVVVDEDERPPGPGEEPAPWTEPDQQIGPEQLGERIAALGQPQVSALLDLPLTRSGGAAGFGLDLAPHLSAISGAAISGPDRPGTYLVGLRRLGGASQRAWMRLTVTDLALTTVEEPRRTVFAVTSLRTGQPAAGAVIHVEGPIRSFSSEATWEVLWTGATDASGRAVWEAPGLDSVRRPLVRRIRVSKGDDLLVLDPAEAPDAYADGTWSESQETWLGWAVESLGGRGPQPRQLAHLFTERPVYRPEEPVHLKGYLRERAAGHLVPLTGKGVLVIDGPGDLVWRYPVTLSGNGSFYHRFSEPKLPTGVYGASFELPGGKRLGRVSFRMEAYRLPRFEVQLHGPDRATLDREFNVGLTATYYAGGRVAARPVEWRVTQFPYTWTPEQRSGYFYSSDGRFSRTERFESTPALERVDTTDEQGAASLVLNPAIEPTAQPRTYVVEATVVGADDQTVTATRRVVAQPPFLLGLKVPRYIERATAIEPEVIAVDAEDKLLAGQKITVRLLHRQWHSHLQASDFSDGVARYTTEVVDEPVSETEVETTAEPLRLNLPIQEAGVYVVELSARDRLGRAQVVAVDLYAGGDTAVTWSKPTGAVFTAVADRERYKPGDTATVVLESPFQKGFALAVVEAPEGNRYDWLPVEGGKAAYSVPILGTYTPRLPVHFLLLRGRIDGTQPVPGAVTDLGKPATLGATAWLTVDPVANQLDVKLDYPPKALPGKEVSVEVSLADPAGQPLAGEVTLWLVDQAVLALGEEQRLDPVPDFVPPVSSHLEARDTRGLTFGFLPFAELPGGDQGAEKKGLLDRQTVRRNFQPVPYFNPAIEVGATGKARVTVKLPDDLTNFKLRAKAISGAERFGYATGHLEVRLPVIVQPALPRFVRPGDRFTAAAVGRVVEGEAGPGRAEARFEGLEVEGAKAQDFTFQPNRPERLEWPVSVPTPPFDAEGRLAYDEVVVRLGVERKADGSGDAFEVKLPVRDDRDRVKRQILAELEPGKPFTLPDATEPARPGSLRRTLLLSTQPALVRMAAGLSFLLDYPYGCTEQRVSQARAQLALAKFRDLLHQEGDDEMLDRAVADTQAWISQVATPNGLAAYWPGSEGSVTLTAWVVEFLVEAKTAGYPVDEALLGNLTRALEQALRSDFRGFLEGESWAERTWALRALAASGRFDAAYGAELARRSQYLDLESLAGVVRAFDLAGQRSSPAVDPLVKELWGGVTTRLYQGKEIYGGLADRVTARNRLILPSETRTVAEITRSLARVDGQNARVPLLGNALVQLGKGDGWGTTNANASALLALSELLAPPFTGTGNQHVQVRLPGQAREVELGPEAPTAYLVTTTTGPAEATSGAGGQAAKVVARAEVSYMPAADGSRAAARREGFVVSRELLLIQGTAPPRRVALTEPGTNVPLAVGDVIEEHVQVVNPDGRAYVAVVVPLAAGTEPLNANLATAPPEARAAGQLTLTPTYTAFLDDRVAFYYNTLPKGTYDFYFRTRATTAGSFIQPGAKTEMMYDGSVIGTSAGARLTIERGKAE